MQQESTDKQSIAASEKPKRKYKKRQPKSKGLGDDIEKLTKATGIKKVVDTVAKLTGKDCGCEKRKAYLNKRFPRFNAMNEADQKVWLEELKPMQTAPDGTRLPFSWQEQLIGVYQRTFGVRMKVTRCGDCIKGKLEQLEKAYAISCDK